MSNLFQISNPWRNSTRCGKGGCGLEGS